MRIFLLNLVLVKRERNEKEKGRKKNLPWFLLIKSLLLNQSLFWGRHTNLSQDGIDQGRIRIMIAGEDIAEKQRHLDLCQGGHASAHDPHPSPCHTSGEVLPRNTQQLTDGLFIKTRSPTPPLTEFAMVPLF